MLGLMKGWTPKVRPYPERKPPMRFLHSQLQGSGRHGAPPIEPPRV
jgi:hypothetical protein